MSNNSPIEFNISGGNELHFLDFYNSRLYVKFIIVNKDETSLKKDQLVEPVNLFLHSVNLQQKIISSNNNLYTYKSMIQCLSSDNEEELTSQLFLKIVPMQWNRVYTKEVNILKRADCVT